jgi:putative ABC transport system permease protein
VLRQILTVSALGVSTLPQRRGTSLVIVTGVACVVAVLVSMLSVTVGLTRMYLSGGGADHAIVLPKNVSGEGSSALTRASIVTILNAPGIAKGPDGAPLADAEFDVNIMPPPGIFRDALQVRGIGPAGAALPDAFRIESGRLFRSGAQELVIGVGASRTFGLKTGDRLLMPGGYWPIVGTFSSDGDRTESKFLADAETLLSASKRSGFGTVLVKLAHPQALEELRDWLGANPALTVEAQRVSDYLLKRSGRQLAFFTRVTYAIGVIMALGALFGATKIMYAAARARTREIGTLRALGFGGAPVALSILLEAALLAFLGAALGVLLAWLLFDGREVYSGAVFRLRVSAPLAALGLGWGVAIALLGGLFPAIRAAQIPAVTALRTV